jgi:hypothetical protein
MQTKNVYCGDGWEFEIMKDSQDLYISMKSKHTPIQRWELQELSDFLQKYLEDNHTQKGFAEYTN